MRSERSVPLLTQLKAHFEETLGKISKSSLADAICYVFACWEALRRYTTDGAPRYIIILLNLPSALWPLYPKTGILPLMGVALDTGNASNYPLFVN